MRHYGDITKLSGYELPVVDVITGGSPCQDLSVAGKRAGLAGERSGLFMEQIRIVKEMRERDRRTGRTGWLIRPRFMVWENVPGAFSSGSPKGADFAAVIEEIIKVAEPGTSVSVCVPNGGWTKSGCYYAEDGSWSIAWRVHDAQFWGVPQRRKRISLVADFGGLSAPEILFERKGLSRDFEPCGEAGQETAGAAGGGVEGAIFYDAYQHHGWRRSETSGTLTVCQNNTVRGDTLLITTYGIDQQGGKGGANYTEDVCPPILSDSHGTPHAVAYGVGCDVYNQEVTGEVAASLTAASGGTNTGGPEVLSCGFKPRQEAAARSLGFEQEKSPTINTDENYAVLCLNDQGGQFMDVSEDVTGTLMAHGHGHQPVVAFTQNQRNEVRDLGDIAGALAAEPGVHQQTYVYENHSQDSRFRPLGDICQTVSATYGMGGNNQPLVVNGVLPFDTTQITSPQNGSHPHYGDPCHPLAAQAHVPSIASPSVVRRLTPLECERLQGYPDGWTDIGEWIDSKGKKHKEADSPRYKALGNSIALPFWQFLARRICAQYERDITMASLFDGIGGFPLVFERCGANAVWASEIEEFPIAVTKRHFPDAEQWGGIVPPKEET